MKDINEILPKVPNMKWGALLNKKPTNKKAKLQETLRLAGMTKFVDNLDDESIPKIINQIEMYEKY